MRIRIVIAVMGLLLLLGSAAASEPFMSCFTASAIQNGPPKLDWSATVVLDSLETTAKIIINCCGCTPHPTVAQVFTNGEGLVLNLTPPGPVYSCPITATWKSTDPVPLTPQRVQALKNGTMSLRISKPSCSAQVSTAYLIAGPCDE